MRALLTVFVRTGFQVREDGGTKRTRRVGSAPSIGANRVAALPRGHNNSFAIRVHPSSKINIVADVSS